MRQTTHQPGLKSKEDNKESRNKSNQNFSRQFSTMDTLLIMATQTLSATIFNPCFKGKARSKRQIKDLINKFLNKLYAQTIA
tara:strand:- start:161 stop:406 length:246 start_codon:yes stop_codon:yes gene_type:complete